MITDEIIHTCLNIHVARAALASIGGDLAARVDARAKRANVTSGAVVARMVKDFSRSAGDDEWDGLDEAARGADQPILSGLGYILGAALSKDAERRFFVEGPRFAPWASQASHGRASYREA
jgi:hypothetical protein